MNKKITSSALAALMIAGSTSFSAFAAMSNGTVVIGDKAFDLAYANDPANAEEITNAIVGMGAEGAVYVKDFDGNWIENATGEKVEASVIPAVTYKDAAGKESKIAKGDEGTVVADGSLKLKSVKAISNTKVEVNLEEAVTGVEAANFAMVKKGTTTALETKSATLSEDGKVVVLETAAMVGGDSYTLTVNDVVKNFTAVKAVKEQVTVKKVESTDDNLVTVTFDKIVDEVSAENIENYKIDKSVVVTGAKLSADRLSVDLTTTGVVAKLKYKVETTNVLSADGTAMKTKQIKDFVAKSFAGAPKVKAVTNLNHYNSEQLVVEFTTTGTELDKESAEKVENYTIAGLEVLSAKLQDDDDDNSATSKVILVTSTQTQGKSYTLKVNNIADTSVLKNVMTKEVSKDFKGGYADKKAPKTTKTNLKSTSNTEVRVYFTDDNKLDSTTALDTSNYVFDKDITVESVEFLDAEDSYSDEGKAVIITTSAQEAKSYKLTVKNVQDEYGNIMTKSDIRVQGKAVDSIPPYVTGIKATAQNKIQIDFDDVVDKKTAVDPTNYTILDGNGDKVSSALSAKFVKGSENTKVEITVPELDKNKTYSVKLDGITDTTGNALAAVKVKVVTPGALNDTTAPTIRDINVVAENEIIVEFDETIKPKADAAVGTITLDAIIKDGTTVKFTGAKLYDNGTKLIMTTTGKLLDKEYVLSNGLNIVDMNRNDYAKTTTDNPGYTFAGFAGTNAQPEADWEQVNVKTIRFTFDQPVDLPNSVIVSGGGSSWEASYADVDADDVDATYEDLCVVDFTSTSVIKSGANLVFDLRNVTDFAKTKAKNIDTISTTKVEAFLEDKVAPVINSVEAVNSKQINITFDEPMDSKTLGSYKIAYEDSKGVKKSFTGNGKATTDDSIVKILLDSETLNLDTTYTLTINSSAKDIAGNLLNKVDVEQQFQGSNIIPSGTIVSGVIVNEPNVVTISGLKNVEPGFVTFDDAKVGYSVTESAADVKNKVTADMPFLNGTTYKIDTTEFSGSVENSKTLLINENATNHKSYVTFDGMAEDHGDYALVVYTVDPLTKLASADIVAYDVDKKGYELTGPTRNGEVVYAYLYNDIPGTTDYKTYLKENVMSGARLTAEIADTTAALNASKTVLTNAKAAATENKGTATVSTDGADKFTNEKWVTQADMEAYTKAITDAVDKEDATQTDVDAVITALSTATIAFDDAKKDGTKELVGVTTATITGTAKVGQTLTAAANAGATNVTYQWQVADGEYADIDGATSATLTLAEAQQGKFIKVVINGNNASTITSAATAAVVAKSSVKTVTVVTGQEAVVTNITGTVLTVANGTYTQALVDALNAPTAGSIELQNVDGTPATLDADTTLVANTMKVLVTAEDETTAIYTITLQ